MTEIAAAPGALARWLREAFTQNLGLKLLSFAFAAGLWIYLHGSEEQVLRTVTVGVVMRMPPGGVQRELMTPPPSSIHVTLRGATRAIDKLEQDGVPPVEIDLRDGRAESVAFEAGMFSFPAGVEVSFIDPPSITLDWQDVISRQIPVQASISGTPAEGYQVKGQLEVDPAELTVTGPRTLVETMQLARLDPFDVSGLVEGKHVRRIAIDSPPARVAFIGPRSATVTVGIARRVTEVRFQKRAVEIIGVAGGTVSPRAVDVTVIGPPEVVRLLRPDQVVPRADLTAEPGIDLDQMKHGSGTVKVTVDLAQAEVEIQPPTVKVQW